MPRFPVFADRTTPITGSVFEKFRSKMQEQGSNVVALHLGDSYAPPPYALPLDSSFLDNTPGFNRYCDTFGVPALREAIAQKLQADNHLDVTTANVMMTCGACNALNISMQGLINPGEDVLLLSPYWPFFRGMVGLANGNVIEVPFYTNLYEDPELDIVDYLDRYVTSGTSAIYVNTPNNPSGKVLTKSQLEQIAAFSRKHNLWVISDEAYDGMTYDGRAHISIAGLPEMFERTLSVFTFSKVYMFSGLRLGYVVATEPVLKNLNKIMVHQLYSPATVSQHAMVRPVKTHSEWSSTFVKHFEGLRNRLIERLSISPQVPEGTYYVFFSIKEYLRGKDCDDVINDCLDNGVAVAPGRDFGVDFADYIRICFTAETPERLELAIDRLNKIFPA